MALRSFYRNAGNRLNSYAARKIPGRPSRLTAVRTCDWLLRIVANSLGLPPPALAKIAPIKVLLSSSRWRGVAVGVPVPGRHSRAHVEPSFSLNGNRLCSTRVTLLRHSAPFGSRRRCDTPPHPGVFIQTLWRHRPTRARPGPAPPAYALTSREPTWICQASSCSFNTKRQRGEARLITIVPQREGVGRDPKCPSLARVRLRGGWPAGRGGGRDRLPRLLKPQTPPPGRRLRVGLASVFPGPSVSARIVPLGCSNS